MSDKGYCLASQDIQRLVDEGVLVGNISGSNIQPSSFEPTIGEECYVIDAEAGLLRPRGNNTILRNLLELPQRQRRKVNISDGFEIKRGAMYLFPLEERVNEGEFGFAKSSPKSSLGRVFPKIRLATDYNSSFDEINNFPKEISLKQWLLVQPSAFNLIVGPGLSFDQLRFYIGDAQLSPSEIKEEWGKNPLLYNKSSSGGLGKAVFPRITEALQLSLDLEGKSSEGVVALRARRNPEAIDLRKKGACCAEDFFEPLQISNGSLIIKPGEHYLFASKEVLKIPAHLNVELRAHAHQGIRGTLHEAGFVDNGFVGDLVFEVTSEEMTDARLVDGMPIGELAVYRTNIPEKLYGKEIGSHYAFQTGPKVAKYFQEFDFAVAAKNHGRLNRDVLVQERGLLSRLHGKENFNFVSEKEQKKLFDVVGNGFFLSRYDCEDDEEVLQPIPYVLLFDESGRLFSYVRSSNDGDRGDDRLYGKHSVGIGGHINRADASDYIRNAVVREISKDVSIEGGRLLDSKFIGTLYCEEEGIDSHHYGLIFGARVSGNVEIKDAAIGGGRMKSIEGILREGKDGVNYETWSKALLPYLFDIQKRI